MTDVVSAATLHASGGDAILAERNAPDLSLKLGDAAPYAYPLCFELINAAFDRHLPAILRDGPTIWAAFLQGDMRFVIERINAIEPATPASAEADSGTTFTSGVPISAARMTAWLYALRAAALALCGSERQQTIALSTAEAACALVASSQLLPWTMRVTRIFVYACSTKSTSGLDRLLQMASEMARLNPVRMYTLTLAIRLAHHIGVTQRDAQKAIMLLLAADAETAFEESQRRSGNTVFNMRSDANTRLLGQSWVKMSDGRYAHQCLRDDPELDAWLLLESEILRDKKTYAQVIAEFPQYREQLRRAHARLRAQRSEELAREERSLTP